MDNVVSILREAQIAADNAATKCFARLVEQGAKYVVVNDNLFSDPAIPKKVIGTMLDLCGGAYLTIDGRQPIIRALKKIGKLQESLYIGDFWSLSKSAYKGFKLNIQYKMSTRQEAQIHEDAMIAAANVLKLHEVKVSVKTYID